MLWAIGAWIGLAVAAGPDPEVSVAWQRGQALLAVHVSSGYHLDPVTPARLSLRWRDRQLMVRAEAHELQRGVQLGSLRGEPISGEVELTVCEDLTSRCSAVELRMQGAIPRKSSEWVALRTAPPVRSSKGGAGTLTVVGGWGEGDAEHVLDEARRVADETGRILLVDIATIGCPPCDLLWNEVIDADDPDAVLDGFVVARIDADHPASWEFKSSFDVRGYPTLLAVDPGDRERSRLVGYAGSQEVTAWLSRVRMQRGADADVLQAGPSSVGPERAAQIAWMLARQGRDGLAPWLDRAAAAPESPYFRLARVVTRPSLEDARWLVERSAGTALEWVPQARELADEEEGRTLLLTAVRRDLAGTTGVRAADLLTLAAELLNDRSAPLLYAAAASSMRARLEEDPLRGRGHITNLATLMERSGDVQGALALLALHGERYPSEPTFFMARARMLRRAGRLEEAQAEAHRGVLVAWGDNLLQAAQLQADLLIRLNRPDEARALAQQVLADLAPAPLTLRVRTHHYRQGLRAIAREDR